MVQFCIMLGKDLRGEQAGVRSASFADGQGTDRNAARHLHNGVEAVDTA